MQMEFINDGNAAHVLAVPVRYTTAEKNSNLQFYRVYTRYVQTGAQFNDVN